MTEAIVIRNLVKTFNGLNAVDNVSFSVPPGAFLVLLGPSGCGKSTMLRMLAGLEPPSQGELYFHQRLVASGERGVIVPPGARNVGLVFQSYALWPHMTVRGNIEWPLTVAGIPAAKRRLRSDEVMRLLGIIDYAARYPGEISGGQQQRVAIARMLAPEPNILLFDEPLSNLDAKLRVDMRAELMRIHRVTGATSVYVTHDQVEAMTMATHVAVMNHGKVEQFDTPLGLLERPASEFVATFIGTPPGNLLEVSVDAGRYRLNGLDLGQAVTHDAAPKLLYRPEQLQVFNQGGPGRLPVTFAEATPIAGRVMVTGWYQDRRLTAVSDTFPEQAYGDTLYLAFPPQPEAIFDQQGRRLA
jgi:iron(III) transport system ATP-binding protein